MEPAEAKVSRDRIRYIVYAKIKDIRLEKNGWYVHFHGSHEAIFFGQAPVDFDTDDTVKITFERITDANAQRPPV